VSAAELIEQIKALSPAESEIIRNFVLNGGADSQESRDIKYMSDEKANQAAARVFQEHDELLRRLAQ
jgi:hypothetical protein